MCGLKLFGFLSFCLVGDFGSFYVGGFESFGFGLVVFGQISLKNNFFVVSLLTESCFFTHAHNKRTYQVFSLKIYSEVR